MDTKSTNGDNTKEKEIESDLLADLEDPPLLEGEDVAELLQRLSSADCMAQGMEDKIDRVLQDLDEILLALSDAEETPTTSEAVDSTSAA